MPNSVRSLILLVVLVWQLLAMLSPWFVVQQFGDWGHLVVHSQDANHHHHADKTLHMDDDAGPVQHVHADSANSSVALLISHPTALGGIRPISPPDRSRATWRSPTLEGPLRPPMSHA